MLRHQCILGGSLVLLVLSNLMGQTGEKEKKQAIKNPDEAFVMKASEANMAEIALAKLAMQRAKNMKVKELAKEIIDDHSKAGDKLGAIAKKAGFSLAQDLNKEHKMAQEKLSKLSGADFDRQYLQSQIADHEKAIKLFQNEAANAVNAELKTFAVKTLPTLMEHLKFAREVSRALGDSKAQE